MKGSLLGMGSEVAGNREIRQWSDLIDYTGG